jgi:hypothetical protein
MDRDSLARVDSAQEVEARVEVAIPEAGVGERDGHGRERRQMRLVDEAQLAGIERIEAETDAKRVEYRVSAVEAVPLFRELQRKQALALAQFRTGHRAPPIRIATLPTVSRPAMASSARGAASSGKTSRTSGFTTPAS